MKAYNNFCFTTWYIIARTDIYVANQYASRIMWWVWVEIQSL